MREFRSPADGETRMFYEVVIAPGYTPEGLQKLKGKSKTLRILEAKPRAPEGQSLRQIAGTSTLLAASAIFWDCIVCELSTSPFSHPQLRTVGHERLCFTQEMC